MDKVYDFKVKMTCEGCSGAVQKVLDKHRGQGVSDFTVDLATQKVTVTSPLTADDVLSIIKKTGKETELIGVKN